MERGDLGGQSFRQGVENQGEEEGSNRVSLLNPSRAFYRGVLEAQLTWGTVAKLNPMVERWEMFSDLLTLYIENLHTLRDVFIETRIIRLVCSRASSDPFLRELATFVQALLCAMRKYASSISGR